MEVTDNKVFYVKKRTDHPMKPHYTDLLWMPCCQLKRKFLSFVRLIHFPNPNFRHSRINYHTSKISVYSANLLTHNIRTSNPYWYGVRHKWNNKKDYQRSDVKKYLTKFNIFPCPFNSFIGENSKHTLLETLAAFYTYIDKNESWH